MPSVIPAGQCHRDEAGACAWLFCPRLKASAAPRNDAPCSLPLPGADRPEPDESDLALIKAARALEPFASLGGLMSASRSEPDDTPILDITGMGAPVRALTRGMLKDAYRASRTIVRLLEKKGIPLPDMPLTRTAPAAMIAAVSACVAEAEDIIDEARISLVAAREIGGPDGWRDLYAAYWDTAHPQPPPMQEGVLQAGDRVIQFGADGVVHGPATVMAIVERPGIGRGTVTVIEYMFDIPVTERDGGVRRGGAVIGRQLLHLRDWPLGFLGFEAAEYTLLAGCVPGYVPETANALLA